MKEFFSNQLNLFYKKNEHRSGRPTLVLVHGLTGSSSAWLRYEKLYEDKYNLLSYDIRGHGRSFKPKNYPDYAIKEFGAELHDLLAAENISDFILVSHSFGTMIALEFLEHWPDMAKGAIFLSPNYDYNKNNFSTFTRIILKLGYIFRLLPYSGKPRGQVDYDRFPNSSDWDIRRMVADMKNTGLRVYFYSFKQAFRENKEPALEKIGIPTLIIHGRKDGYFSFVRAEEMAQKIKNSRLLLLDNADHILVLNNFSELSEAISEFTEKYG